MITSQNPDLPTHHTYTPTKSWDVGGDWVGAPGPGLCTDTHAHSGAPELAWHHQTPVWGLGFRSLFCLCVCQWCAAEWVFLGLGFSVPLIFSKQNEFPSGHPLGRGSEAVLKLQAALGSPGGGLLRLSWFGVPSYPGRLRRAGHSVFSQGGGWILDFSWGNSRTEGGFILSQITRLTS